MKGNVSVKAIKAGYKIMLKGIIQHYNIISYDGSTSCSMAQVTSGNKYLIRVKKLVLFLK